MIAEELGINHGDWMRNVVAKYQKETEQAFGHLRFENGTVTNSVGAINTVKFVYLIEDQATFLMTLSTNTSEVGYINLNQMADATGKRIDNWLRLQETKELIAEFDQQQIDSSDLRNRSVAVISIKGGSGGGGGTWAHPDIALQFAQWCSPSFALQVSRWVREWMTTGRNPLIDSDRVGLRSTLKDDSRVRMTDQVKVYLESIKRYDDKKYESQTAQAFGGLRFQIGVPDTPTGNPPQFVYLTEDQATFLMTLLNMS